MDNEFIDKVFEYTTRYPDCRARAMAELAPGLVTVYDVLNEFDTYFDSSRWEESEPGFWGDSLWVTGDKSIGVLQGVGCAPQVNSFAKAAWFAGRYLKSTSDVKILEPPRAIDLEEVVARFRSEK